MFGFFFRGLVLIGLGLWLWMFFSTAGNFAALSPSGDDLKASMKSVLPSAAEVATAVRKSTRGKPSATPVEAPETPAATQAQQCTRPPCIYINGRVASQSAR